MARNVKSTVKLNMPMVRKVTAAAKVSVAQTAEAIQMLFRVRLYRGIQEHYKMKAHLLIYLI